MITILEHGTYMLAETKRGTKLLYLGHRKFAWIMVRGIGTMLIWSSLTHKIRDSLASGTFYLYEVEDEPYLSDQRHLELQIGNDTWQGYLLPTGLPTRNKTKSLFIPTHEVITRNPEHRIPKLAGLAAPIER